MEYRFWMQTGDVVSYDVVTRADIHAETVDAAITAFCRRYRFKLLEPLQDNTIWVEDERGATIQFAVHV